jgi:penicillin-binding protein 1A
VKELITALRIERAYSKQQILETYLNSAPFLYNVVGIEMAARTYYDKSAADLDVLESATLIGMLKGTRYYNPILHPSARRSGATSCWRRWSSARCCPKGPTRRCASSR